MFTGPFARIRLCCIYFEWLKDQVTEHLEDDEIRLASHEGVEVELTHAYLYV